MDIVMQGGVWPKTYSTAEFYLQFPFVNDVIISVMEGEEIESSNKRIRIVKCPWPLNMNRGQGNINLQIITSLQGLLNCNSIFCAKTRTDQRLFDLEKLHRFHLSKRTEWPTNEFPSDDIYVLGIQNNFPFSTQDHVFWGFTTDLINLFDLPLNEEPVTGTWSKKEWGPHLQADKGLNFDVHLRMPVYLCAHYYAKFDPRVKLMLDNWREHLLDHCSRRGEAMELWNEIKESVFKPFPKVSIYWEKMNSQYPYEMYESQGEYYAADEL